MTATMEEVRRTLEAERLALALAARERERELMEQMHHQTAAAQRQAEVEAETDIAGCWLRSGRQLRRLLLSLSMPKWSLRLLRRLE
eukprot:5718648-Pyramimonas_sp.AAC.1